MTARRQETKHNNEHAILSMMTATRTAIITTIIQSPVPTQLAKTFQNLTNNLRKSYEDRHHHHYQHHKNNSHNIKTQHPGPNNNTNNSNTNNNTTPLPPLPTTTARRVRRKRRRTVTRLVHMMPNKSYENSLRTKNQTHPKAYTKPKAFLTKSTKMRKQPFRKSVLRIWP